jgi:hypothetical protein
MNNVSASFPFVIAGTNSDRGLHSPIGFWLRMNGWITIHLTCTCLQILALTRFANPKVLIAPHNRSLNRFYRIVLVMHQAAGHAKLYISSTSA